jgi:CRISPR/Cas system-associated exonuclease Cas4 (RecB family)
MRNFKASEIGSFLYCQRAWWYQSRGIPSENQAELAAGSEYHLEHGKKVIKARLLRAAGWILMLAGVASFAVGMTLSWFK